jgi:hypothetical protein
VEIEGKRGSEKKKLRHERIPSPVQLGTQMPKFGTQRNSNAKCGTQRNSKELENRTNKLRGHTTRDSIGKIRSALSSPLLPFLFFD